MKKTILIAAVTLASASAFASKARVNALQSAAHISDIQDVMTKPDRAAVHGEWATLEFGQTALGATNTQAEGGFIRKMGDSAMGAYFGQGSASITTSRAISANYLKQENPLRLFYAAKPGDLSWGVGLLHMSSKRAPGTASAGNIEKKQDGMAVYASAESGDWDARLGVGLSNTASYNIGASATEEKLTGKSSATLGGGWKMDTMYIYAEYGMGGFKHEVGSTATADRSDTSTKIGIINSHKKDGTDFFYGISYSMVTLKDDATTPIAGSLGQAGRNKSEINTMPIIIGVEAEATSWMVLRGSITEDFNLLGMSKTKYTDITTADNEENTGVHNTTVRAGAGFKWNKFTMDATIKAAADDGGDLGTNDDKFLNELSLTYMF